MARYAQIVSSRRRIAKNYFTERPQTALNASPPVLGSSIQIASLTGTFSSPQKFFPGEKFTNHISCAPVLAVHGIVELPHFIDAQDPTQLF